MTRLNNKIIILSILLYYSITLLYIEYSNSEYFLAFTRTLFFDIINNKNFFLHRLLEQFLYDRDLSQRNIEFFKNWREKTKDKDIKNIAISSLAPSFFHRNMRRRRCMKKKPNWFEYATCLISTSLWCAHAASSTVLSHDECNITFQDCSKKRVKWIIFLGMKHFETNEKRKK